MLGRRKKKRKNDVLMADISNKSATQRLAIAQAKVYMRKETLSKLRRGEIPKGDVLTTAKIAGIIAAKKTQELIPLCHPISIDNVGLSLKFNSKECSLTVIGKVVCFAKTGVEMEALTAVMIAALTIYDMCKPLDRDIVISEIRLLKKSGGKSGTYTASKN